MQNLSFYIEKSQVLCFSVCTEPQNRAFYVQQIYRMRIFVGVFKQIFASKKEESNLQKS